MANFSSPDTEDLFSLNVRGLNSPERLTEVCNIKKTKVKVTK